MSVCVVHHPGQDYLIRGEKEEVQDIVEAWAKHFDRMVNRNLSKYIEIYRRHLGIPQEVDSEEEEALIHEKYGETPSDDEEFVFIMRGASKEYREVREEPTSYREWFEERGFETEDVEHSIQFE